MPSQDQQPTLSVCLIEQNPLGLAFLRGLLRKDSSLQDVRIEKLGGGRDEGTGTPVIVIDNCGLPLPLSECLRQLRCQHPDAKYVILDHELPMHDLLRLLSNKIDGFLSYGEVSHSLVGAIHSVAEGNIWIPREVLREYVQWGQQLRKNPSPRTESMTARENQIIELVERRFSNKEIADILRIRESTVKFHLSNIYSKLQVGSRYDLIGKSSEFPASECLFHALSPAGSKA